MGNFDSVQIQSDAIKLDVEAGSIKKMDVASTAVNTQINLAKGVKVTELVVCSGRSNGRRYNRNSRCKSTRNSNHSTYYNYKNH